MLLIRAFIRRWMAAVESLVISLVKTAYYHSAAGWNLFTVCQKWSGRSCIDLVGISDYRGDLMPGGICIFKENQEK